MGFVLKVLLLLSCISSRAASHWTGQEGREKKRTKEREGERERESSQEEKGTAAFRRCRSSPSDFTFSLLSLNDWLTECLLIKSTHFSTRPESALYLYSLAGCFWYSVSQAHRCTHLPKLNPLLVVRTQATFHSLPINWVASSIPLSLFLFTSSSFALSLSLFLSCFTWQTYASSQGNWIDFIPPTLVPVEILHLPTIVILFLSLFLHVSLPPWHLASWNCQNCNVWQCKKRRNKKK